MPSRSGHFQSWFDRLTTNGSGWILPRISHSRQRGNAETIYGPTKPPSTEVDGLAWPGQTTKVVWRVPAKHAGTDTGNTQVHRLKPVVCTE